MEGYPNSVSYVYSWEQILIIIDNFNITDNIIDVRLLYYDKWIAAFSVRNIRAGAVAEVFVNQVISRFSVPSVLHTDEGRNFDSRVFHELLHVLRIKKIRTTSFHPQSNGIVERQHRTLTD